MTETRWFTAYEQAYERRPQAQPYGPPPATTTDDEWLAYCEISSAATWFAGLLLAPCVIAIIARAVVQHINPYKPPAAKAPTAATGDLS
ncbi:hypothetical protein ACFXHA_45075 [Nocardia sp. NPDC059240]|uniref:hypothetical protein n=1 Tax=Nocardia sp. NPDC059240 TaxID=3346786 RepID=UPI0036A9CE72